MSRDPVQTEFKFLSLSNIVILVIYYYYIAHISLESALIGRFYFYSWLTHNVLGKVIVYRLFVYSSTLFDDAPEDVPSLSRVVIPDAENINTIEEEAHDVNHLVEAARNGKWETVWSILGEPTNVKKAYLINAIPENRRWGYFIRPCTGRNRRF